MGKTNLLHFRQPFPEVKPLPVTTPVSYRTYLGLLILGISLFKLIHAFTLELSNDEAYYWLYSQHLKWNYFDHPPLIAVWIRLFTANLWLQQVEGFVRLGSIAGSALATWFLYKAVAKIHSERAAWFAACLYNASFYAGLTAGLYSMPDAPQMVFWTAGLWMIACMYTNEQNWLYWILFGIAGGLCIMSKVHGVFLWFGFGLYVLLKKRNWLSRPQLYVALLLTLLIASPILFWNIRYDFVTYRFHSQRVTINQFALNGYSFIRQLISQLAFNNPINVVLVVLAFLGWRRYRLHRFPVLIIYNLIGLPLALVLLFISLFRDTVLVHWNGPAYIALFPMAAVWLAEARPKAVFPRVLRRSLSIFIAVLLAWNWMVHAYPGTWGSKDPTTLGRGDISLDLYGWQAAAEKFQKIYQADVAAGRVAAGTPMVCNKWWGAHVEYYFCRPLGIQMIGLGSLFHLHEYFWTNNRRKDAVNFTHAYCIVPADEWYDAPKTYAPFYQSAELVTVLEINRGNRPAHNFYVYRLSGWKNRLPLIR